MKTVFLIIICLFFVSCAGQTKFQKQCESYGFGVDSADYAVCVEREIKQLRGYFERKEAEEKAKSESFYRELERKRLGLDIK